VKFTRLLLVLICLRSLCVETHAASGPIYVPLDNWVYPAFKRLAAMGFEPDAESLSTPWTREQCAVLLDEAEDLSSRRVVKKQAPGVLNEALRLIAALRKEFPAETSRRGAGIDSVYTRYLANAGKPLADSYHLGQTFTNDFGRPYGNAGASLEGFSSYATYGNFSAYLRGEFQQAAGATTYSGSLNQFLAAADGVPSLPIQSRQARDRFDPLEAYVGVRVGLFDVTVGKQSIQWGPDEDSPFLFSNNAEPVLMGKISQAKPILLPGPFHLLGRIRTQFIVGELAGHHFPPHPLINAQKITFQLTENLELGFTRTAIFGGSGHPLTTGSILASFFSSTSSGGTAYGSRLDPGDRRCGFDFRWRVPFVRRYLSVYSDSLADDEPSPLASPRRSAWGPGLYITQLPKLPHLDLRFETYSTWLYRGDEGGLFFYWNNQYRDAYTNQGNLLGSWLGRDARAYVARSTYWVSPRKTIALLYRQKKTGSNFLPGGGTQTDVSATFDFAIRPECQANFVVQYERYFIPILAGPRNDVSAQFQLTFHPTNWRVAR
jgi:hypothetical protein